MRVGDTELSRPAVSMEKMFCISPVILKLMKSELP